jgi:hypothetical protein
MLRTAAPLAAAVIASLALAGTALADPSGSKNSFSGTASCSNGLSYPFVVNSGNGQGSGSQNQNTGEWTPAHFLNSTSVFHPSQFINLTFTFTPAGGTPQSSTNNDTRPNGKVTVICTVSGSQSDPAGDTFSLSGMVAGWIS